MAVSLLTLASLDSVNGEEPSGSLIEDANGDLLGTAGGGGADYDGTVFEVVQTANGYVYTPTALAVFDGDDGSSPEDSLIADANGDLFGTTYLGGANGETDFASGTVFEIANSAMGYASTPTTLVSFDGDNGGNPVGSLIFDASGDLFGTTRAGGSGQTNDYGTVFEIAQTAGGYAAAPTTLVTFNGADGNYPSGSLLTDADGDLFGTTAYGGAYSGGTVFEIAKTGGGYTTVPTTLANFDNADGAYPFGSLIADANGDLFGTTEGGGAFASGTASEGDGTVFEIAKTATGYASAPTVLVSFDGADGENPIGSLIADAKGDLFGTTQQGGSNGYGTVFEIAKTDDGYASAPITLASFDIGNGESPDGGLFADAQGNLFGTTVVGGAQLYGSVFEITGSGFVTPSLDLTITGAVAGQAITDLQTATPFSSVTIADNNTPAPTDTVTVTLSDPADGTLSNLDGGAYDAETGVFTIAGSAAAVTSALQSLVFTPTIAPGVTEITTFTIAVDDGLVPITSDSTTTVKVSSSLGGGQTFDVGAGAPVSIHNTDDRWDTVSGTYGTVYLTSAQASVLGNTDVIYFSGGARDAASLYNTNNGWDTIYGANGAVTLNGSQASVFGGNDYIYFNTGAGMAASLYATDDDWDTVIGSNGSVTLNDAQASLLGSQDAVFFNGPFGDAISIYDTSEGGDSVYGSNGIVVLNGAQATVFGQNDQIYLQGASAADSVNLYDTFDDWDNVTGSSASVMLDSAQASFFGGGDVITLTGAGAAVSLYGTNGVADVVNGSGAVNLNDAQATTFGGGDYIYFGGVNQLTIGGGTNTLVFSAAIGVNEVTGFAPSDTMLFSASDFANFAALSAHLTQSGANAVIALDASDSVTLVGVSASSLTASEFKFV